MDVRRQGSVGSSSGGGGGAAATAKGSTAANIEKLYAGFFENSASKVYDFDEAELTATVSPMVATTGTATRRAAGYTGKLATPTSLISRLGAATSSAMVSGGGGGGGATKMRPSTAVRGVGYTSDPSRMLTTAGGAATAAGGQAKRGGAALMPDTRKEQSPEEKYKALERKIQDLLEQSILMSTSIPASATATTTKLFGNFASGGGVAAAGDALTSEAGHLKPDLRGALNKAKEASSLDRKLLQLQDAGNFVHNFDLTFSVLFNMAHLYALNDMHIEALNTYNMITKNKMFANANRLKINMGNIYVRLGMFPKAIKMYRMSLDQVPVNQKELRLRVTHNIGVLFVRMGQYSDAAASFEFIMAERGDIRAGMHLVLCYYALGDVDKMKRAFQMMLDVSGDVAEEDENLTVTSSNITQEYILEAIRTDELSQWETRQQQFTRKAILMTANLISAVIEESFDDGYNWCVDTIKSSRHQSLASELDLNRAIMFLKQDDPQQAIESLQYFEKRETNVAISASINLTFIHLMMNNLPMATKYAESMRRLDSYNPATLINNGVCEMVRGDYETARTMFEAALELDATSFEALYNLGLIWKHFNEYETALSYFRKLSQTAVHETHPQVIYQMGNLYEKTNDTSAALEFYLQMLGSPFLDDEILRKIGDLYERDEDQQLAFHYHHEAYRLNPSNVQTTNWVATHYIRLQVVERAIPFYQRAILGDPTNTYFMIRAAGCMMKVGQQKRALRMFQDIYKRFPENIDCLRALIRITHNGHPALHEKYQAELTKLSKAKETRQRIISGKSGRTITSASLISGSSGTGSAVSLDNNHRRQQQQQPMRNEDHLTTTATAAVANSQVAREISEQYEKEYFKEQQQQQSGGTGLTKGQQPLQQQQSHRQQVQQLHYSDPLGPMAERPRTAARPKTAFNDENFSDDDLDPDEMLPE